MKKVDLFLKEISCIYFFFRIFLFQKLERFSQNLVKIWKINSKILGILKTLQLAMNILNDLKKIKVEITNGLRIRSKCDWPKHCEKSSNFFFSLEKSQMFWRMQNDPIFSSTRFPL